MTGDLDRQRRRPTRFRTSIRNLALNDPTQIALDAPVVDPIPYAESKRPKLKKLRLGLVLMGLSALALISTVFGMMMAVASDLPSLENAAEFRAAKNSILIADDKDGTQIAKLTGNKNRILLEEAEISANLKNAVIAIEDKRFYEHGGVDYRGIARALWQDVRRQKTVQGGSTITQQFVKNALEAQGKRSVFQKLRESALAYHLERQWSKGKILTQYLNTIYFGNGAYGVESAVRTYFGDGRDYKQNDRLARDVTPDQAATLAAIIASPTANDPVQHPIAARERRDTVLKAMLEQGTITKAQYDESLRQALPAADEVNPPRADSTQPYFSSWVTQQLVERYGPGRVFGGGLKIQTTIDPELQEAADQAVKRIAGIGPSTSLVAIENKTGEVKAMVGGSDFANKPFNIAVNGHRQPGSAFKPFTLIAALENGVSPFSTWESRKKEFPVPNSADKNERFIVNNYQDQYSGVTNLASATAQPDNSVYAEMGLEVGPEKIAKVAQRMGIETPISTNPAMTLGGLKAGLTPLELAYAYSTLANGGKRTYNDLAPSKRSPVAIEKVRTSGGDQIDENDTKSTRIFSKQVADQATNMLTGVLLRGTGRSANLGANEFAAGKTGTTENYGDAWFVGYDKELTVAVWVGYPDKLKPMETEYGGRPVAGGTYPADIWRTFMMQWIAIRDKRQAEEDAKNPDKDDEGPVQQLPIAPEAPAATGPEESAPPEGGGEAPDSAAPDGGGQAPSAPDAPQAPATPPPATPQPGTGGGSSPNAE